jgi:hypothetical protein
VIPVDTLVALTAKASVNTTCYYVAAGGEMAPKGLKSVVRKDVRFDSCPRHNQFKKLQTFIIRVAETERSKVRWAANLNGFLRKNRGAAI